MAPRLPLRVGFIGFDGVNAVDLAGPLEAFTIANDLSAAGGGCTTTDGPPRCYQTIVLGLTARIFTADSGLASPPPGCSTAGA